MAAVPGLPQTSNLLGIAALADTRFTEGSLTGTVGRGAANIEQLMLLSPNLKVVSSGRVGLVDGRLGMTTVATTGNFRGQSELLRRAAPSVIPGLSTIGSLNQLISDRTVVVDTVGTLRNPQTRLRQTETLQANARAILINQIRGRLVAEAAFSQIDW